MITADETWFWVDDSMGERWPVWGTREQADAIAAIWNGYNRNEADDDEIAGIEGRPSWGIDASEYLRAAEEAE